MRRNPIRERIRKGVPSFGIGTLWPSPELVEFCGFHGFDWLWMDLEHGAFDRQALSHTVRAAEVSGMVPIGRLPQTRDLELVLGFLETGVMGVITSHTHSREDVEFAVQAVKYPPLGKRSAGAMRPADWGVPQKGSEYYEVANQETLIMCLVEDMEGIDNLDDILRVKELDAVVIGPGDLSLTLGHPGQKDHPLVASTMKRAQEKVLASGKALQVTAQDPQAARRAVEEGALLVRCTVPSMLSPALKAWLQAVHG